MFFAMYDQCSLGERDAAGVFPLDSGPNLCENNLEVFTQKRAIVAAKIAAWGEAIRRLITVESGLKRWLRGCFLCMLPDEMYTMVVVICIYGDKLGIVDVKEIITSSKASNAQRNENRQITDPLRKTD